MIKELKQETKGPIKPIESLREGVEIGHTHKGGPDDQPPIDYNDLVNTLVARIDYANYVAAATSATTGTMTVAMNTANVFTITPTGNCTFNASGGVAGQRATFVILTSGTTSRTLTWNTNFKVSGTLATGTTTAKYFCIDFICKDGTLWVETGRTAAM